MPAWKMLFLIALLSWLGGCVSIQSPKPTPLAAIEQLLRDESQDRNSPRFIERLQDSRTWLPYSQLTRDPVEIGKEIGIPVQNAMIKLLGPSREDASRSLAAKIWLIEHAEHTIDMVYYIFKEDLAGEAVLGALCNAVQRGVDIRLMVDAIGSVALPRNALMALESCAQEAGFMHAANGEPTNRKARIQAVIFNAFVSPLSWINRRSHDKLLVVDGAFPEKTAVMTGGRNISLDYYGIDAEGRKNPDTYRDLEILLRTGKDAEADKFTVGNTSGIYYSLLFLHKGNLRLHPLYPDYHEDYVFLPRDPYVSMRNRMQQRLDRLKRIPAIRQQLDSMELYLNTGFDPARVRLAHELANLTNRRVVTRTRENLAGNPNSIMYLLKQMEDTAKPDERVGIVSPYIFLARYYDQDGNLVTDEVADARTWLRNNPGNRIEIITNSVLTSDNFFAQSIIDMDVVPRLLLSPALQEAWLSGEIDSELTGGEAWKAAVENPRIRVYQTGRLDAALLGNGSRHYGKLHAKFLLGDELGFVGTANFDYRSRLFNNEMGFFFQSRPAQDKLSDIFEQLKATSYRWGSPEWLQMRDKVMAIKGLKGWTTRNQRFIYRFLHATGLDWLI